MNIHNSNLSFNLQDEDLRKLFTSYNEVLIPEIINNREIGRWLGFGFVHIGGDAVSQNPINKLHETNIDGRIIKAKAFESEVKKPYNNFNIKSRYNKNSYQFS